MTTSKPAGGDEASSVDARTIKFLKQLGIVFLAAAVMMILPRVLVASVVSIVDMAIAVATIYILYRILGPILGPIYRDWRRRRRPKPPQSYYSDRR